MFLPTTAGNVDKKEESDIHDIDLDGDTSVALSPMIWEKNKFKFDRNTKIDALGNSIAFDPDITFKLMIPEKP